MTASTLSSLSRVAGELRSGLPRAFWALLVGTFITRAGTFVVPLLFVYLTQTRGLSLPLAGLVVSLYGVGSVIGTLLGGAAADRLGRRVTMIGALLSGAFFMVTLGLVQSLPLIALATFALSVTSDAFRPASHALVADIVPAEHRVKAFSLQYWSVNLGFSVAALVGGYMASKNFTLLFFLDALTTVILAGIILRWVPESRAKPLAQEPKGHFLTPFTDRKYLLFLVLNFSLVLVFFQHLTGLPEQMRAHGLSTQDFGVALATNGLLIVLLQPLVTRLARGRKRHHLLALASALTGLGFGLTAFAQSLFAFGATVAVWTLGEILFAPINASVVADASPQHLRGRYQGAFGMTWSLAMVVSPAVGPTLIEHTSLATLWATTLLVGLGVAAVYLLVPNRILPRASDPA